MSKESGWSVTRQTVPPALVLPWRTGAFYCTGLPHDHAGHSAGTGANPNVAILWPHLQPNDITWATVAFEIIGAVAGSDRIGLYEAIQDDHGTWQPGDLVADFGSATTNAAGAKSFTPALFVPKGMYFCCLLSGTITTRRACGPAGGSGPGLLGFYYPLDTAPKSAEQVGNQYAAFIANGLPARGSYLALANQATSLVFTLAYHPRMIVGT